jgi:hypothetical protein
MSLQLHNIIINQEEGGSSPSSHSRAIVALGKQKAAVEERVTKLQKHKAHLEAAFEQESLQLQQVHVARELVDKVLKDMASLETEENQGYMQFLFTI